MGGLAITVVGLAGLVSTCLDCFDRIQTGREYAREYEILSTKLAVERLRFVNWVKSVGLDVSGGDDGIFNSALNDPTWQTIERLLNCIIMVFTDTTKLTAKYGLVPVGNDFPHPGELVASPRGLNIFRESYDHMRNRIKQRQKEVSIIALSKWAIKDQAKFQTMIVDLKDLNDGLVNITQPRHQRMVRDQIQSEIEAMTDIADLRLVQEGCAGTDDDLSDVASRRLLAIESDYSRLSNAASYLDSSSSEPTFFTAPSRPPQPLDPSVVSQQTENALSVKSETLQSSLVPQNRRLIIATQSSRAVRTENALSRPMSHAIDPQLVGLALKPVKESQSRHLQCTLKNHGPIKQHERGVIRRLTAFAELENDPYPWISLAPLGNDLFDLMGAVEGPRDSPYGGGIFFIHMKIPESFPFKPPHCRCVTRIYHPNIDARGNICLSILDPDGWTPTYGFFDKILLAISALLDDPSVDDPLVPEIAEKWIVDPRGYAENARLYALKYAMNLSPDISALDTSPTPMIFSAASSTRSHLAVTRLRSLISRISIIISGIKSGNAEPTLIGDPYFMAGREDIQKSLGQIMDRAYALVLSASNAKAMAATSDTLFAHIGGLLDRVEKFMNTKVVSPPLCIIEGSAVYNMMLVLCLGEPQSPEIENDTHQINFRHKVACVRAWLEILWTDKGLQACLDFQKRVLGFHPLMRDRVEYATWISALANGNISVREEYWDNAFGETDFPADSPHKLFMPQEQVGKWRAMVHLLGTTGGAKDWEALLGLCRQIYQFPCRGKWEDAIMGCDYHEILEFFYRNLAYSPARDRWVGLCSTKLAQLKNDRCMRFVSELSSVQSQL